MDYFHMTAPCGLDCFNCPLYLAGKDETLRTSLAKSLNLPLERAVCRGCREEKGIMVSLGKSEPCAVYQCIEEKGYSFCCDCEDFPCQNLQPYADKAGQVPHNTKVFHLCLIKKLGLVRWAEEEAKQVRERYFTYPWKI